MQGMSLFMTNPWYFSYDDDHMSWIYTCILACYLTLVGTWMSPNLWDCKPLTFWAISTSPSSYYMVVEFKEAWIHSTYPLTISIYKISFGIKFHDFHFGYTSALSCKTNPCRKMNSNYKWCSKLLMNYINLENPTQVRLHDQDQHHHQGMLFHLREALLQDMSQSNSTRCEYTKILKRKMVTPFWA